jgi:hypothetical protein
MAKIISGRVKKTPQSGITSDRYEFLGLEQAEPDLGDPLIGPSSTTGNPVPPGNQYLLINVGGQTGKRYWLPSTSLTVGGLSPGSFTVFNNDVQVGIANSFNVFNFVGTGVTVDFVSSDPTKQTGIATVRIQVTDLIAPGNQYEIPYHDPSTGFLKGATNVVFRSNNVGIGSSIPSEKLDVVGNVKVSGRIGVNTAVVGFITANNSFSAISTITDSYITNLNVGTGSTIIKTLNGNVGIGITLPQYKLDVEGPSRFNGLIYDYTGSPGDSGNALLSNGAGTPPTWGVVGEDAPVGIALSIATKEATNNQLYYIGFSSTTNSYSSLYVDSNGLYYNPSTVRLGIGTQPQYSLDVDGTIRADQIIAQDIAESPSVVTTSSTSTAVLDTFTISQYRSARYALQITTTNQLRPGSGSVSTLNAGKNYSPGTYTEVPLISSGIGTGAKATVIVGLSTYPITGSFDGVFTTSANLTGIETGFSVLLSNTLTPSAYEQSKLTEIQVTNSGAGFTSIPTITVNSPIIAGNPVSGVGVGSTAVVTRTSMKVTNVVLNSTGVTTSRVPTVSFSTPVGVGSSAIGYVGFGISTFTITNPGSGYTSSPTVTYNQTPTVTPVTRVGLGISDFNIQITPGTGYNTGITTFGITGVGGIGSGASIVLGSVNGSGGITDIDITNVGSGYTVPPIVTVFNSSAGVGAAITITTMVVSNISVDSVGSGFGTSKPSIGFTGGGGVGAAATVANIRLTSIEVNNSGFGYTAFDMPVTATVSTAGVGNTVGLGIYSVSATTGLGYTTNPGFTISSPTISPLTGAALTSVVGYGATYNLLSGPGYGGTTVYYVKPITSNTFRLTKDSAGTNNIVLGYDLSSNPNAYIGGRVSSVSVTNSGSGYVVGETLTVNNNLLKNQYAETVGTGFSFTVSGPLIESFQISDVMVLQSVGSASSTVDIIEYAGIANYDNLGDYSADLVGSNVNLKLTPTYAHNTIKLRRSGIEL